MKEMKCGVKVNLRMDFRVIKETLERVGIVNKVKKIITPSCYIYMENGEYYICHFKELLGMFDEIPDGLDEKDTNRRNAICTLLDNWGLVEIIDMNVYQEVLKENIFVLKKEYKKDYTVNHKFDDFYGLSMLRNQIGV